MIDDATELLSPPSTAVEVVVPEETPIELVEQDTVYIEIIQPQVVYIEVDTSEQVEEIEITTGIPIYITIGNGGGATQELVDVTMQDAVPAYVMVTADGRRADSNNTAHFGKVVGMTTTSYAVGEIAHLVDDDEVTSLSWGWAPGAKLFLNGTNVSTAPPSTGWSQMIGVARNANIAIIQLRPPILL